MRTQEMVILDDASSQHSFSADPYIDQRRARSILCLPLINQAKLSGILYLENNLTPRLIWDALGSYTRLPFHLQAKGEFEYVRAKPLGDGFVGVPVKEFRGALLRPFFDNRMAIAGNFLIARGYTGQTLETIPFQPDPCPAECIVGVPLKSYLSMSWTYYFRK
jgi:GAF domain-containing protein